MTTKYKNVSPLSFRQGHVHYYLGMWLNYITNGKVWIIITKHIKGILESVAKGMNSTAKTSSANHLFTVQEDGGTLTLVQADLFQTIVAKILFISFRSYPDLNTELVFVTMPVRNPEEDNYKKLTQTISYTRATQGMELTLDAESMDAIWWWIDATYYAYPYLKGHSRGMMSVGEGATSNKSIKHRINSRRPTDS